MWHGASNAETANDGTETESGGGVNGKWRHLGDYELGAGVSDRLKRH